MKTIHSFVSLILLCLGTAPSLFGQAVLFDFNTPGQLTNNFGVRAQSVANAGAVWVEKTSGGVSASGALDNGRAGSDASTLTYIGEPFFFATNDGSTLNASIMFKGQPGTSAANLTMMQLGFIANTNGAADGNSPLNWLNFRVSQSFATSLVFEAGCYITTNLGTAYMYSNYLSPTQYVMSAATFTNWYQLNATFTRTNLTNLLISGNLVDKGFPGTAAGTTLASLANRLFTNLWFNFGTNMFAYFRAIDTNGVDRIDNFAAWMTNGVPVLRPLANQSSLAYRPVTFKALVDGTPGFTYTWYTNGVVVGGATGYTLTLLPPDTMSVAVAVTNSFGGIAGAPVTLTVTPDTAAPGLVSVGSLDGLWFGVAFDELLDPTTAATPGNYSINGATPATATLMPDGKRVKLTLASAITGTFTVTVQNVTDLAGNATSSASASGVVMGLTAGDFGNPLSPGSSISFKTGDIDVLAAGGTDFWLNSDSAQAVLGPRTGDFDVAMQVASLTRNRGMSIVANRDDAAAVALVAKENWMPGSRMAATIARPADFGMPVGSNAVYAVQRNAYNGGAGQVGSTQPILSQVLGGYYPNVWLRLRRVNNTLTYYWWTNNVITTNWVQIGQQNFTGFPFLPDTLLVGPAASAHFDGLNYPISAQVRSFGDFYYPGATLSIQSNLPTVITSTPNNTITLAINGALTLAPANEIQYIWQRGNGSGGFTNVPFLGSGAAANQTYTSPTLFLQDNGCQFRAVLKGPGTLAATSAITTVLIWDTNPPAVTTLVVPLIGSNALVATFFQNLDLASAGNLANYTVVNSWGQSFDISSVLVEPSLTTNTTRVTLFTTAPLTNGTDYMVTVNNVKATNGFAILPTTARVSLGKLKVEIFNNLTLNSVGITNVLWTNKFIGNLPDYVFYTNRFGWGWREDGNSYNSSLGDNYVGRISGWFVPPSNGVYRFYMHGDDYLRLNLNTNGPDPAGKMEICEILLNNGNFWNPIAYTNGLSTGYALQAGVPYYLEGIWREVSGGDHMAVAFREAGDPNVPHNDEVTDDRFFAPIPLIYANPAYPNPLAYVSTFAATGPSSGLLTNPTVPGSLVLTGFANLTLPVHGGMATLQFYTNLLGTNISDLTNSAKFIANLPDVTLVTNQFGFSTNLAASVIPAAYGARISAYFVAPTNGFYRFHLKADDSAQLFMNTNGTDPAGRVLIAFTNQYTVNGYAANGLSVSPPISLTNGQLYYLEGLWKQGTGGDGFAVTWRSYVTAAAAAASTTVPVAGEVLTFTNLAPNFNTLALAATNLMGIGLFPVRVDLYQGISDLAALTSSPRFLGNTPDAVVYTNAFGYDSNLTGTVFPGTSYSAKVAAYFCAPTNAFYRFYVKADDAAQLFMSTNFTSGYDPAQKVLIASTATATGNSYTNVGSMASAPIWLKSGQYYYTEALFSQSSGSGGFGMTFRMFPDAASANYDPLAIPMPTEVAGGWFFRPVYPLYPAYVPASPILQQPLYTPLVIEIYTNLWFATNYGGSANNQAVTDLLSWQKFQAGTPDLVFAMSYFGWNRDIFGSVNLSLNAGAASEYYGARVAALFVPPTNGTYKFWSRSDDGSQLWFNPSGADPGGKVLQNNVTGTSGSYTASANITNTLVAGQRYYMEVLFREVTSSDGFSVAFSGGNTPANTDVALASFFLPITNAPANFGSLVQTPAGTTFNEGTTITLYATNLTGSFPLSFQWKSNGIPIPGAASSFYSRAYSPADSGSVLYSLLMFNAYGSVEKSMNVNLTINPDLNAPYVTSVVGNGLNNEVLVTYSRNVLPVTGTNLANYMIPGLSLTGAYLRSANAVSLTTTFQNPGQRYALSISGVRDMSYSSNYITPVTVPFSAWNLSRGLVNCYRYDGLNGNTMPLNFFAEPKYIYNMPDQTFFQTFFGYNTNAAGAFGTAADNYAARVFGWFIAPSNGLYRFYIRSDDGSQLYMNTTGMDPAGKVPIAATALANLSYGDLSGGQTVSPNVPLVGGQMYYMEALLKEGSGNDGVSVAFREAGDPSTPPNTEVIPSYFFAYVGNPDPILDFAIIRQPQNTTIPVGTAAYLQVMGSNFPSSTITYQWQRFDTASGTFRDVLASTNVTAVNSNLVDMLYAPGSYQYRALVSQQGMMLTSAVATVTVTPISTGETAPVPAVLAEASCSTNGTTVMARFSERVTAASANTAANYAITNQLGTVYAVTAAALQSDQKTVLLTVAALPAGISNNYTLKASSILDVDDNSAGGGLYTFYVPNGAPRYDIYPSQSVGTVPWPFLSNAPSPNYLTGILTNQLYATSGTWTTTNSANFMENYVARVYGYYIPPSNGLYRFFIASDDQSEFWLNTNAPNGLSPTGAVLIASAPSANLGYVNVAWPTTMSRLVALSAGQPYYFEARLREGGSGDYVAVAVREAADSTLPLYAAGTTEKIPNLFLSSPAGLTIASLGNAPYLTTTPSPILIAPVVVGVPATYYWYTNSGSAWVGAGNGSSLVLANPALSYDTMQFALIVSNAFSVVSNGFTFVAGADADAPAVTGVTGDATGTNVLVNFSEMVDPNSATNFLNYLLTDGAGNPLPLVWAALLPGGRGVVLNTATPLSPAATFSVAVTNISDLAIPPNTLGSNYASFVELTFTPGFLVAEFYNNIFGGGVANLTNDARFLANQPTLRTALASFDWRTTNFPYVGMSNYGVKVYGWFTPPTTENYTFYMRNDDGANLLMNTTGADPLGKTLLTAGGAGGYTASAPLPLTAGQRYYIEALLAQGAGQEYLQVDFRPSTALAPAAPNNGTGGWTANYYASAEVADGSFFGVYANPDPTGVTLAFTQTPQDTTVALGQPVTLSAAAVANTPANGANNAIYYQWQIDDGTGNFTNALAPVNYLSDYAMRGNMANFTFSYYYNTSVRVIALMPGGFATTSSPVAITITNDLFEIASVGCLDGTNVTVAYTKPYDPGTGLESLNYTVTLPDGDTTTYSLGNPVPSADGRTVTFQLVTGPLPLQGSFTVSAGFVWDVRNLVNPSLAAPCTVFGATYLGDVGSAPGASDPLFRGSYTFSGNGFDVKAGGSDIWNASDGMYFIGHPVTGDFDVRVRVVTLTNSSRLISDVWAKASIMGRIDVGSASRMINVSCSSPVMPGWPLAATDNYQFNWRDANAGSAANSGSLGRPAYPNAWLRLVRKGSFFYGYRSVDGVEWMLLGARDTLANGGAYPDTIWVGFGTTSHNNGNGGSATEQGSSITALYRDLYFVNPPTLSTTLADQTANVGSTVAFTVSANNPPNSGSLWYRWRKNGVVIPMATGPTLTLANLNLSDAATYSVLVGNDGGAVTSSATLTLNNLPPVVVPESGATFAQGTVNALNSLLLPNDSDPESQSLSVWAVSGVAPITWSNSFDAGLPAGTAVFGNASVAAVDGLEGSGCLKLTDAVGGQAGGFVITDDLTPGKSIGAVFAQFGLRLGDGSANPADGLSFNLATDLPLSAAGNPEEGMGTGLSVNFDNYDNGGGEAPVIEVKWAGQILKRVVMPKMTNQNYVPVVINLYSDGKLDVWFNNQPIYSRYQTPFTPIKNGRFGLYARTGGQFESHWIDSLSITAFTLETANGALVTLSPAGAVQLNTDKACGDDVFYYLVSDPQGASVMDMMSYTILEANPAPPTIANATDRVVYTNSVPVALPDFTNPASGVSISASCRLLGVAQIPAPGLLVYPGSNVTVTLEAWDRLFTNTQSFTFTVFDYMPPLITVQPASLVVTQNGSFSLSVSALGDGPLGYTWYRSGTMVGNDQTYTVPTAAYSDYGVYRVVVTNQYGQAVSSVANVMVAQPSAAFCDFNTPGQLRNNFNVLQPSGLKDGLVEMPAGGTALTPCLDLGTGAFDVTAIYTNQAFAFNAQGQTIAISVMVKVKTPTTNAMLVEVGLVNSASSTLAPADQNGWLAVRVDMTNPQDLRSQMKRQDKLIAGFATNDITAAGTTVMTLVPGRWYKLTAVWENNVAGGFTNVLNTYRMTAALMDYGDDAKTPGPIVHLLNQNYGTNVDLVNAASVYPAFRVGDASGADLVDNFTVYYYPFGGVSPFAGGVPPMVPVQPQPTSVLAGQQACFSIGADQGSQICGYQWYSNGVSVLNATNFYCLTAPLLPGANGAIFSCLVTNLFGTVTSGGAAVTVTPDSTVPALLSVGSADGQNVGVRFNKSIYFSSAMTLANYTVTVGGSPVTLSSVGPQPNGTPQMLGTNYNGTNINLVLASPLPAGAAFTVTVNNLLDYSGNALPNGSSASGTAMGLIGLNLGSVATPGSLFSSKDGEWEVTASGTDIWGTSDVGYFVLKPETGDFDIKVRLAAELPPPQNGFLNAQNLPAASTLEYIKGGLNVRESTNANARCVQAVYTPSGVMYNGYYIGSSHTESSARAATGASEASIAQFQNSAGPAFPNAWLRIRRVNDTFTTYTGTNGVDWLLHGYTVQPGFSTSVQIGVASCLHVSSPPAKAVFAYRDFGPVTFPVTPVLNLVQDLPATMSLVDYQNANFTFAASISGLPGYELQYCWQRWDAFHNTWTNIQGVSANLGNYITPPVTKYSDNGAQYRCVAKAAGVTLASSVCTLTVSDTTPPTLARVQVPFGSTNVILVQFSEPITPATLANLDNYTAMTASGQLLPILSTFVVGVSYDTVALTVNAYMTNGVYILIANNQVDTAGYTIAPNASTFFTVTLAAAPTFDLVANPFYAEIWTNLPNTTVPDLTNSVPFRNNTPWVGAFIPTFGEGTSGVVINNVVLWGDSADKNNYGTRIRAYFVPPTTDNYRFYIRSDDLSQLWINPNGPDAAGKVLMAANPACCQSFSVSADQSPLLFMVAGQKYYVEGLHKEGSGGDYLLVTWRTASGTTPADTEAATAANFAPIYGSKVSMAPAAPVALTVPEGATITFAVSNLTGALMTGSLWYTNGVPVLGGGVTLTKRLGVGDTNVVYAVSNSFSAAYSVWNLTIIPDQVAPALLAANNTAPDTVMLRFSEAVDPVSASAVGNYELTQGGVLSAFPSGANSTVVVLKTTPLAGGSNYTVTVNNVKDTAAAGNAVAPNSTASFTAYASSKGFVAAEVYTGLGAGTLTALTNAAAFTNRTPYKYMALPSWNFRSAPTAASQFGNYGARLYAWFQPPSNGVYRFYTRSDDPSMVMVNTNLFTGADPAGKVFMAQETACCKDYMNGTGGSYSPIVSLNSNQVYYVEAVFAQGGGGEFVQMAWREMSGNPAAPTAPNSSAYDPAEVAAADYFVQFIVPTQPIGLAFAQNLPATTNVYEAARGGINLSALAVPTPATQPVFYQWQAMTAAGQWTNAMPMLAYNMWSTNYWFPPYPGAAPWLGVNIDTFYNFTNYVGGQLLTNTAFRVIASVPGLSVTSTVCQASFVPDAEPPYIVGVTGNQYFNELILQFNEDMSLFLALGITNYSVPGLTLNSVSLDTTRRFVILGTSPQTPGATYSVSVNNLRDGSSGANLMAPTNVSAQAWVLTPFFCYIEQFQGLSGSTVADLTGAVNFQVGRPDVKKYSTVFGIGSSPNFNYSGANIDTYGTRISGFFTPPTNGYYVFFLTSDDSSQLFMNTNLNPAQSMSPAGKVLIAVNNAASTQYSNLPPMMSTNIWLNANQRYYLEALQKEGTGGDYVGVTFRGTLDGVTVPDRPLGTVGSTPNLETIGSPFLSTYADPGVASLFVTAGPPAETNVTENDYITLAVSAYALPSTMPLAYVWQSYDPIGGVWTNIPGAYSASISFYVWYDPILPDPTLQQYRVNVYTIGHETNLDVTLHIATDTTPPYLVSAGSLDGLNLVAQFNERLLPNLSGELLNWYVYDALGNWVSPIGVRVVTNTVMGVQTVLYDRLIVTLETPITGGFTLGAQNMTDWAYLGNTTGDTAVAGVVASLIGQDVGSATDPLVPGSASMFASNTVDVIAGGSDIWLAADGFYYVYRQVAGNFDIKTRVASLAPANTWSKAGLMARVSTNANSRHLDMFMTPPASVGGQDTYTFQYRDSDGAASGSFYSALGQGVFTNRPSAFGPNVWLRLKREGSVISGFFGSNGVDWVAFTNRDTLANGGGYPPSILVGMAVTAHNNVTDGTTLAQFRDLYFPLAPSITTQPVGTTVPIHQSVTFTVEAVSDPAAGVVTYQWWKNGAMVVGATSPSLTIPDTAVSDAAAYTVSAANDGGGVLSDPAELIVLNDPPVLTPKVVATNVCDFTFPAAQLLLGNTDPEGDPLTLVAVSGAPPVTFTANFDDGLLPAGTAIYGSSSVAASGGANNNLGSLHLTEAATSLGGSFIINDLLPGHALSSFTATFKVWVAAGNATPADGFSFCFATNLPDGVFPSVVATGWDFGAEEGAGDNLVISFDNYNSGLNGMPKITPEAPAIDVKWGTTNLVLAHVPVAVIQAARWIPVAVTLKADGTVSVAFDGTNVVTDVPSPYTPMRGGRFGFGARTGGSYETHWVDDISIAVTSAETSAGGVVSLDGPNGTVHYVPPTDLCGVDQFYYFVTDGQANGLVMSTAEIQHVPMVRNDTMTASAGIPSTLAFAKLLANDFNYDGVPMSLASFTQPAHGTVTIDAGVVTYKSVLGFAGSDPWTYTLTDGRGNNGIGTVTVRVTSSTALVVAGPGVTNGVFWTKFVGLPRKTYQIETATDVAHGPWTVLTTVVADANGAFAVTNPVQMAEPARFYRAIAR